MSLFWLQATIVLPLRVSANEVRVWEQAKLKCLDRCGSGAASFGALVVVAHLGAKGIVLTGILFLSHPC